MTTSRELVQDEGVWDSEFCVDVRQHEVVAVRVLGAITAVTQQTSELVVSGCTDVR